MAFLHAVIWLDHHNAHLIEFDPEHLREHHLKPHVHNTRQHRSDVRSEHAFFSQVCDAMATVESFLVTGAHTVQADFRHYIEMHRPALAQKISGWETVDHPTAAQLVALARRRQHQAAMGLVPRP